MSSHSPARGRAPAVPVPLPGFFTNPFRYRVSVILTTEIAERASCLRHPLPGNNVPC
jgi:hypothetical protein